MIDFIRCSLDTFQCTLYIICSIYLEYLNLNSILLNDDKLNYKHIKLIKLLINLDYKKKFLLNLIKK